MVPDFWVGVTLVPHELNLVLGHLRSQARIQRRRQELWTAGHQRALLTGAARPLSIHNIHITIIFINCCLTMGESNQPEKFVLVARAEHLHIAGLSCAPAILGTFAPRLGMDDDQPARVKSRFGGGMIGSGGLGCAVTGSMMAIVLARDPRVRRDPTSKQRAYSYTAELWRGASGRRGSLECRDILGTDTSASADTRGHRRGICSQGGAVAPSETPTRLSANCCILNHARFDGPLFE